MEKIRIITDSASDLLRDAIPGVTVLPMTVRFGDTEYRDGVDITARQFYEKLVESECLPATSLISPAAFSEAYQTAAENGETVIVITVTGKLSGTYQSAVLAAEEFEGKVFVVDSKNVSVGERLLVLQAVKLAQEGLSPQEIVEQLEQDREKIRVLALLDTLEYLKKGGRIPKTVAFVGGALSIKPVIAIKDGEIAILGSARGSKNGNNYLIKEIKSTSGVDFSRPVCLGYTGFSDDVLRKYVQDSQQLWEGHEDRLQMASIGPTIGTHAGPGAIAVAFFVIE